ncbi:MAG TPA: chemotaxis protein CheD [Spirochaetota bacterium]|nr:chemotaxis protein CheD [Spirochaetota bacterium]HOL56675.1 chemotaxis protein CheD [Spirochaetota bacterium]HPP03311.1 chemotaxis protein CheD [Spirochaetota bacterium]
MSISKENLEVKIIPIGGLFVTNKPMILQTVLGSCVSVVLYDKKRKNAGMNHIVLPGVIMKDKHNDFFEKKDLRYGIFSLEKLIYDIQNLGSLKKDLTARIYGASYLSKINLSLPIQKENVEFVKAFLNMSKIEIIDEFTLQKEALKVIFNTETGECEIIKLPPLSSYC